mgnify:CR=1 FL=1
MKSISKNKIKKTLNMGIAIMSIFFFAVLIQGCSKDDLELSYNDTVTNTFETKVNFSSKVMNPYDFIGKYHNDGLQFVLDEYEKRPQLKAERQLEEQIKDLTNMYMEDNDIFSSSNITTSIDLSSLSIMDKISLNQIRLKKDRLFLVRDQQIYFDKLSNIFNNNISSPQNLIDKINEIESEIITNKKLTEEAKSQLLITSAVAKYSSIFWIEFLLKNNNMEHSIRLKNGSESGSGFSNWWKNTFMPKAEEVIKADFSGAAAGAVMGAITGGGAGSIVPGAGTVTVGITGAVVGGAQGAIGSSAIAGIIVTFW